MTIKIEFPADRYDVAAAMGKALLSLSGEAGDIRAALEKAESSGFTDKTVKEIWEEARTPKQDTSLGGVAADAVEEDSPEVLTSATGAPRVDANGVAFSTIYCSSAKDPFYATGKSKGAWKKKKGVTQEAYDNWYLGSRPAATTPVDDAPIDASGVFSPTPSLFEDPTPKSVGELLKWTSEQQAAEKLTKEQIAAAYVQTGIEPLQLIGLEGAEQEQAVAVLYQALAS